MPTNAANRKPAARKAAKPRETAAQKRARLGTEQVSAPVEPTPIAPGVSYVPDAPEVSGGALRLSGRNTATEEREILFYVDDVAYTIPKRFGYTWALEYARVGRTEGATAGVVWAMERALGTVGFNVLFSTDVSDEDCEKMVAFVIGRVEGLPDPK